MIRFPAGPAALARRRRSGGEAAGAGGAGIQIRELLGALRTRRTSLTLSLLMTFSESESDSNDDLESSDQSRYMDYEPPADSVGPTPPG